MEKFSSSLVIHTVLSPTEGYAFDNLQLIILKLLEEMIISQLHNKLFPIVRNLCNHRDECK